MADSGATAERSLRVFISYSRRDQAFVDDLVAALDAYPGFEPYIDREDIAAGEDWQARLGQLIAAADTVVFCVSPDAVASERCAWEVDEAERLAKRLIPVVTRAVDEAAVPERLKRLNYIFFSGDGRSFGKGLKQLVDALNTDIGWIREHTRMSELAFRWDGRGRDEALLLRGRDIDDARDWLARRPRNAPQATDLQRAFITASADAEAARNSRERQELAVRAKLQRRASWLLALAGALVLAILGVTLRQTYVREAREAEVLTLFAQRAIDEGYYDRAMRMALQGLPPKGAIPFLSPWSHALEAKLAGAAMQSRLIAQFKHAGPGSIVAFSPDGRRVVTASPDHTVKLQDGRSGAQLVILKGHRDWVNGAAFSPDGQKVVTASYDTTARIWSAANGALIAVTNGHERPVLSASFSPDGSKVATTSINGTSRVWNATSGSEIAVLKGHNGAVYSAAFSPDGTKVVTASEDKTARLWDSASGVLIAVLEGHEHYVVSAAFSADGTKVVTASADHTSRLWHAKKGLPIAVLQGHEGGVWSAAFSPDGTKVITASDDKTARLWDAASGVQIDVIKGHEAAVTAASLASNGTTLVTLSSDDAIRQWDLTRGAPIVVFGGLANSSVLSAEFSADGTRVVTGSADKTARLWDAATGAALAVFSGHNDAVNSAAFSPDGTKVVTASDDTTARLWDAVTSRIIATLNGHNAAVNSAVFSSDSTKVATVSQDMTAQLWDASSGAKIAVLTGHKDAVTSAAFSPNSSMVVTTSHDATTRIWDVASHGLIKELHGFPGSVLSARFTPDGAKLITLDVSRIQVWDLMKGLRIKTINDPNVLVRFMLGAFTVEGDNALTIYYTHAPILWSVSSGVLIAVVKGHESAVRSAAFSPDGSKVVTASDDGTARIWDVSWATKVRGAELRDRVCAEKLRGADAFTAAEAEAHILIGMAGKSPCDRRGPLSLRYWTDASAEFWQWARGHLTAGAGAPGQGMGTAAGTASN